MDFIVFWFRREKMKRAVFLTVILLSIMILPISAFGLMGDGLTTVEYTRQETSKYGLIGTNEGLKDSYWKDFSSNSEYLGHCGLGYGHGNRLHQVFYFDFSNITAQLTDGKSFIVYDVSFYTTENEGRHYLGEAEINPIFVDWVSGQVGATWNNIEGSGTGAVGHGSAVQVGGRINSTTFSYPIPGEMTNPNFAEMIQNWLNREIVNYGFMVRATATSPSSIDSHQEWNLSITYEIVPEPTTLALLGLGGLILRRNLNKSKR
jgi:hypothetical protein